jgi:hypothetical protein
LKPGYYNDLAALNAADPEWVKVYVDGEFGFVIDGRPIYLEWQDRIHCAPQAPDARLPILVGQDFGLTPAAVFAQIDPRDWQIQVLDELVSEDMGAATFAQLLNRKLKQDFPGRPLRAWGDPAGEQRAQTDERTPFDVMLSAGVPMSPAPTNDWVRRREAVAHNLTRLTMLGRPGLVVDPKAKRLHKAMMGGYCYRRLMVSGGDRYADKPDKNRYSHVAEALQYLCVGEGYDAGPVDGLPMGSDGAGRSVLRFKTNRAKGR